MYKDQLLKIKPETGKQILDINNAVREFVKLYSYKANTRIQEQHSMNFGRYCLLRFQCDPDYVFFKFSRDPYFRAKHGLSETINIDYVKRLVRLYNENPSKLCWLYFGLNNGYFYRIHMSTFLKKAYIETESRQEHKTKYVIAYKHLKRFK